MNDLQAAYFHHEPEIKNRGFVLSVLTAGTVLCAAITVATTYHIYFAAAYGLLFLPFLFISRQVSLYVFAFSFSYALPILTVHNQAFLRLDDILFMVLVSLWFMDKSLNSKEYITQDFLFRPLLIWLCINAFSLFFVFIKADINGFIRSFYHLFRLTQYIFIYFLVSDIIRTERTRITLLRIIWISTVCICFYGLYQRFVMGISIVTGSLSYNHAHIGVYLLLTFFLYAGYIKYSKNLMEKVLVFFSLPLMVYVLFLSGSRAAILALFGGLLLAMFFSRKKMQIFLAISLAVIGIQSGFDFMANLENVGIEAAQFRNAEQSLSMFGRYMIWIGTYDFLTSNPLYLLGGTGLGAFGKNVSPYVPLLNHANGAHNNYLHHLTETGIAGLLSFLYIHYVLLKNSLRGSRNKKSRDRWLYYGYFCGIFGLLITGTTQETFSVQTALFNFLGFFFLVTALVFKKTDNNTENNQSG